MPERVTEPERQSPAQRAVEQRNQAAVDEAAAAKPAKRPTDREVIFDVNDVQVHYGDKKAIRDVTFDLHRNEITALIGPSGCGKSTFIRCLNRMNDLIPSARVDGEVIYHGENLYAGDIDPVQVRKRIGMVFQKPNPFPKSIYDNVAYGPRVARLAKAGAEMDDIVERSLRQAALWDEVKDRLKASAMGLCGGQQQRLCIARCLAVDPEVILMDEPCSALDPVSTLRIEDLIAELKDQYTIVIVTHNMQQAARVSDSTAYFTLEVAGDPGRLVEVGPTSKIFTKPDDDRTEAYITGRFG